MPIASMAEAMVLAVYMPPQAPAPGQLLATTSWRPFSSSVPARVLAIALEGRDDVELLIVAGDLPMPGLIVPP